MGKLSQPDLYFLTWPDVRKETGKQGAEGRGQGAGSREQGAGSREQGAGSREQGAGSREQGAGSRGRNFLLSSSPDS
ncbi:hypothetical protein FJR11_18945 [Anabaena sp. UHCC 0187]|nr:hypothetical protein [Anabaena sp. UHCC 0187]